jgi:hypothetical protein
MDSPYTYMQVQTIITAHSSTRYFQALYVLSLVLLCAPAYSVSDLGMCGTGGPSQACVSTVPPPQTPVRRGCNVNSEDSIEVPKVAYSATFSVGEFNLPFHPGVSVDSPGCSLKKKPPSSSPYWYAPDLPDWHDPNTGTRSMPETWCNCGQALIRTGRQAYCWFARCGTTGASAELCCGPTGADPGRHGTPTVARRSCVSAERRLRGQGGKSTTPAILRRVQSVWVGGETGATFEYYVNSDQLSRHNIRYRCRSRSP